MCLSVFLIIILPFIFIHLPLTCAQVYDNRCLDTAGRYTANSVFSTNLNITLTSLISNATNGKQFFKTSTGQGTDESFGLFLCRGDISISVCQSCVTSSSYEITSRCPNIKEAIIWYDECMLRYGSNSSRFAQMEETPVVSGCDPNANVSDPVQSNGTLVSLMNRLVKEAVNGTSSNMFATGDETWGLVNKIYGLVQCTPDISESDCEVCLSNTIGEISKLCYAKRGARILKPSCNIRFEYGPFYTSGPGTQSPPPPGIPSPRQPSPPTSKTSTGIPSGTIIAIVVPTVVSVVLFSTLCYFFVSKKARRKYNPVKEDYVSSDIISIQSLQFELGIIEAATNNFSDDNKIGEGGFGSVYKGTLPDGEPIAVKRLSRGSGQGGEEFKNEVALVAKLQHRNLARLLGFCLEREEKILIYEYVPNHSLDYFLFDPEKQAELNWSNRYKIIQGIARGMLYLHEDSRLRIIHRDLKASNILLDEDMSPKVSDFGTSKIFGADQTRGNTSRIAGTYGYMSPEYVMQGQFSVKSDVYSFGVLILEIISGKKISSLFQLDDHPENLLSYAWKLWRNGTPLELMDPTLTNSCLNNEVIRCIQIGLLCVHEDPDDRPTIATLVLMLKSFSFTISLPHQPAFFVTCGTESDMPTIELESDQSTSKSIALSDNGVSINLVTITEPYPR